MKSVPVQRGIGEHLVADGRRVILKRFFPSKVSIAERIVQVVAAYPEDRAAEELKRHLAMFRERHMHIEERLQHRFGEVNRTILSDEHTSDATKAALAHLSDTKRSLVGSMFMHEYAVEAAALFNPSIVPHPAAPNAAPGEPQRVLITLRSCGEGHISSISFREGVVTPDGRIVLEPNVTRKLVTGDVRRCVACEWQEASSPTVSLETFRNPITGHEFALCDGVYTVKFNAEESPITARVLFPQTPEQSNGIEDARFVRFVDDDGTARYFGTITAYDGKKITPQLIETADFATFTLHLLSGDIHNKGMALFPRKVNGKFWMLSRQDDVSVLVMSSDDVLTWNDPKKIVEPREPWECFKMGNCGSPMETKYGWLVLTHGVGPFRRYGIGAVMLDINDPTKVIGRLRQPLIEPNETEREGYVPNVVYTCGAMISQGRVIIPYAQSDSSSTFASILVDDIAAGMGLVDAHEQAKL